MHTNKCFAAFDETGHYWKSILNDTVSLGETIDWLVKSGFPDGCLDSNIIQQSDVGITVRHQGWVTTRDKTILFHGWKPSRVERIAKIVANKL